MKVTDIPPAPAEAGAALAGARIVVLGAAGFIGRSVAHRLTRAGARLWLAVRDPQAAEAIFRDYGAQGTVAAVDLERDGELERLLADARPAVVFNLAAYGIDQRERDEALSRALNADLVRTLAGALPRHRDDAWTGLHLVQAGSALEYGEVGGDLREETVPNPTTTYGRTKLDATRHLEACFARGALRGVTARLFTVYGPGEHPGRLLPSLLAAARSSDRVPLSAGTQRRDFTWVGDVADGLARLASVPDAPAIMNLCTGQLTTVRDFVLEAARVLGIAEARLGFGDLPQRAEEMAHDRVNVARLERLLGWRPTTTIREGVAATARFLGYDVVL